MNKRFNPKEVAKEKDVLKNKLDPHKLASLRLAVALINGKSPLENFKGKYKAVLNYLKTIPNSNIWRYWYQDEEGEVKYNYILYPISKTIDEQIVEKLLKANLIEEIPHYKLGTEYKLLDTNKL